jgi:hypothetical protein
MKTKRLVADFIFKYYPRFGAWLAAKYGSFKPPKKSYSLYGEDLLVLELFNYASNGAYVDVGAFHERWISNTHALSKAGWVGTVVDVEESKLISFKKRPGCRTLIGAIVPQGFADRDITLYKFNRMSSEYDTIDRETADDYATRYKLSYSIVKVPAIPIDKLLADAASTVQQPLRYLNIDVEGADEAIIVSIDPSSFGIEVLQFEDNLNLGGSKQLRTHLTDCGYTLVASQGGTHTYAANKLVLKRYPGRCEIAGHG